MIFIVWRHEEGESGLRGKNDEGRGAEKLNAKLLVLWQGISLLSLHTQKFSKSKISRENYNRDEWINVQRSPIYFFW